MDITYYKRYEPIFGSWHIVRELGEGSFGKVFEIEREDFGYTYKSALKAITIPQSESEIKSAMAEGLDEDSISGYFRGIVQDMVDEFILMSKLKGHSNIVSYEDHKVIAHNDGLGWDILIRMELLTPLLDYIKKDDMDETSVIKLGIDMCRALEQCKKYNIIHRDIKPENMFISELGDFKLGDFGVARTAERTMGGMSKKGTYVYMAPEVYKGEEYGASADMYSLGVVLYRLCNHNRVPFLPAYPAPISYRDREEALSKSMKGEPIPAPANASEELAQIILKACAYKSKDRYVSPTELRLALEKIAAAPMPVIVPTAEYEEKTESIFRHIEKQTIPDPEAETVPEPEKPAKPTPKEEPPEETIGVFCPREEKTVPKQTPVVIKEATEEEAAVVPDVKAAPDETTPPDDETARDGAVEQIMVSEKEHRSKTGKKRTLIISIVSLLSLAIAVLLSFVIPFDTYVQELSDEARYEYRTNLYGKILEQTVIDSKGGQSYEFEVYDRTHLKSVRFGDHLFSYSEYGVLIRDDLYYSNGYLKSSSIYDVNGERMQIDFFDEGGILYLTKKFELDDDGSNIICDYNSFGIREKMIDSSGVTWNYQYDKEGTFLYRSNITHLSYAWSDDTAFLNMWDTHYAKLGAVAIGCSKISFVRSIYDYSSYEMIGTQYVYIQDRDGKWTYIGSYFAPDEQEVYVEISLDKPTDVCGLAIVPRNNCGPNSFKQKLSEVASECICYEY